MYPLRLPACSLSHRERVGVRGYGLAWERTPFAPSESCANAASRKRAVVMGSLASLAPRNDGGGCDFRALPAPARPPINRRLLSRFGIKPGSLDGTPR